MSRAEKSIVRYSRSKYRNGDATALGACVFHETSVNLEYGIALFQMLTAFERDPVDNGRAGLDWTCDEFDTFCGGTNAGTWRCRTCKKAVRTLECPPAALWTY